MKINELVPPALPGIVIRTIQGLLTEKDHEYLKKHCDMDVVDSWFCDDRSIELDIKLNDGTTDTIDLGNIKQLALELDNYQEIVFYTLLVNAADQLPEWVYNGDKFCFDWTSQPELTLQEFDAAFEKVWNIVFNGKGPTWWRQVTPNTWCVRGDGLAEKDALTSLEADILRTMFGLSGCQQADPLPVWLRVGNFPVSRELMKDLEELHRCFFKEILTYKPSLELEFSDQQTDSDAEPYVSPFTGQPV